jgi:hypothetical protein
MNPTSTNPEPGAIADNNTNTHIGMRANALDFTLAVEQTAIHMSKLAGWKEKRKTRQGTKYSFDEEGPPSKDNQKVQHVRGLHKSEKDAWRILLDSLGKAQGRITVKHSVPYAKGNRDLLKDKTTLGRLAEDTSISWRLDAIISPSDGIGDLLEGHDHGTVAAMAGGPPDTFVIPWAAEYPASDYAFVLAAPASLVSKEPPLPKTLNNNEGEHLPSLIEKLELTRKLGGTREESRERLTLSTMGRTEICAGPEASMTQLRAVLGNDAKIQTLYGSPILAGIASLSPETGTDAFAAVLTRAQALILAAVTRAIGEAFYVFPVEYRYSKDKRCPFFVKKDTTVYRETDLLSRDDYFVIVTGITGSQVLKGVRYLPNNHVATETLCYRAATRSQYFISHKRRLPS